MEGLEEDDIFRDFFPEMRTLTTCLCEEAYEDLKIKIPLDVDIYPYLLRESEEDQILRQKYNDLIRFIKPLRKFLPKLTPPEKYADVIRKLRALWNLIHAPSRMLLIEKLCICEYILKRLEPSFSPKLPEEYFELILIWNLGYPDVKEKLYELFNSVVDIVDIRPPEPIQCICCSDEELEPIQDIPHALKMEIAQLDKKFSVKLDELLRPNNTFHLVCHLENDKLANVPPIEVDIPVDYPLRSPTCSIAEHNYLATPFFLDVRNALTARIASLPKLYSLSHILGIWELSVQQACSPSAVPVNDLNSIFGV